MKVDFMYGPEGPTKKQEEFRDLDSTYKLFGGGVGSGKTWTLCAEALRMCLIYPGNRFFMCRQDGVVFKETTLETLLKLVAYIEEWTGRKILQHHHQVRQKLYFTRGSVIQYGGLSKTERRSNIKSLEIGGFAVDEASEITPENFRMLKSRLKRWTLPDGSKPKPVGLLASNPENCWLIDDFVEEKGRLPGHGYVMSLTRDNPRLDSTYESELRASNPKNWVEQYLDGKWQFSEGRVWPEFDKRMHVFPNAFCAKYPRVPEHATFMMAIDHGQRHPTCALAAWMDKDENVFVYDEYFHVGVVSQHCREIGDRFPLERFERVVLDRSAWNKNMEKRGVEWSVADEYWEHNINVEPSDSSVDLGLAKVAGYMFIDPEHRHPVTGLMGAPRLYINGERCPNLVRQVEGYIRHKNKMGEYEDRPRKKDDDGPDALRYLLMAFAWERKKKKVLVNPRYRQLMQVPAEERMAW